VAKEYVITGRGKIIIFKCKKCPFQIDTRLYSGSPGNPRTKAAAAMHDHHQREHVFRGNK
jgi:hypothetical protein